VQSALDEFCTASADRLAGGAKAKASSAQLSDAEDGSK
jgi:hypothetical protein